MNPSAKSALIVVDIQNDFLPGGALAVHEGHQTVAEANAAMGLFDLVVATQDWHPPEHGSFASNHAGRKPGEWIDLEGLKQVLWPVHCVAESEGARFAASLNESRFDAVFRKGTRAEVDSYSGFFDNGRRWDTGLARWLRGRGVERVGVLGLATDYCVKFTLLDALTEGFAADLLLFGCRPVDLSPGDGQRAVEEMRARGARIFSDLEALKRGVMKRGVMP
jgi:nicotinamidase/pyrazinamidase